MAVFTYQPEMLAPLSLAAAFGYLLGALPFGYVVARARGVNIFEVGSRSSGSTNVRRILGAGPGNAVLALDFLKGALAAGWPLLCAWQAISAPGFPHLLGYVGLAAAVFGHSFSCFTRFKGGKGVAAAGGGLMVLMPLVGLVSAGIWGAVFYATRYVSLASILAATSLPVLSLALRQGRVALTVTSVIAVFVIVRHRANISRLLGGTEKRFERKKPEGKP
ncbi:MAG: glycerol-3-phosphate 1-O-acyltransferase PlsY [Opitutaceae bacterium]